MESSQIILLVILVALSSFFSASETALTAFRKVKIKDVEKDSPHAAKLLRIWLKKPNEILAALLLGNTIVNIFAASIATLFFVSVLKKYGLSDNDEVSAYVATIVMTIVTLIFGEITPKIIAKNYSETISKTFIHPIYYISIVMYPFVAVFIFVSRIICRIIGIKIHDEKLVITEEEIKSIVSVGEEEGVIEQEEKEMIHSIFEFGDITVREVMIPRIDMFAVEGSKTIDEIWENIVEKGYSRIPVYKESIDNIIGIFYIKDLISIIKNGKGHEKIGDFIKEAYFVPDTKLLIQLLKEFKEKQIHMAVVLDEYGGTTGIITIEDVLEEIVGDINDEYDENSIEIEKLDKNIYKINGKTDIYSVNKELGIEVPEMEEYDTIAGYIYYTLSKVPEIGDQVVLKDYNIKVTHVENHRIKEVILEKKGENLEDEEEKA